jgi:hypothetical protein
MKRIGAILLVLLPGCSASSAPATVDAGAPVPVATSQADSGAGAIPTGGQPPAPDASAVGSGAGTPVDASAAPPPPACDAGTCASVTGLVQRTASTKPTHGGKGTVYVAIFDGNPITNSSAAMVGRALLPNEDMSSDTAQVAYRVDGVPARAQPYQAIAFLDDANTVTAQNPKPGSGDLVSLDLSSGFSGVPVTVPGPGDVTLDLPLNVTMP